MVDRVGRFEIHEKLGEGGFGRVWKALDPDLQVWRALKEPWDQSPEFEAELREARLQAQLDHDGIVRMVGTERAEGRFFLVLEYVDGVTLREHLSRRSPLPLEEADRILRSILEALAYAHGKGVVHLDLKPENIFVLPDGRVKIGDFGLARMAEKTLVTMSSVKGTLHYMAPEQLDGHAGPAADLWAVGAIAYELYTGDTAIEGRTQGELVRRIAQGEVRDLGRVPEARRGFVGALLRPDPAERCASAAEALGLLGAVSGSVERPVPATRPAPEAGPPEPEAPRRRRGWGLAFALGLVLLAAGFGYAAWTGLVEVPWVVEARVWLEGEPEGERPPAEFYRLAPGERVAKAWEYLDERRYGTAYRAASEVLARADGEARAEARFLRASVAARFLDKPWHAVADLEALLGLPGGAGEFEVPATLELAEAYLVLGRPKQAIVALDRLIREHPEHPRLAEALAVADRAEAVLEERGPLGLGEGRELVASLLPNNWTSLVLTCMSFLAFLMPNAFWIAMGFHSEQDGEPEKSIHGLVKPFRRIWQSKVHRALFLGFLVFQVVQFYLNQKSAASTEQELHQAIQLIRTQLGG